MVGAMVGATGAQAAPVDLSTWVREGAGIWNVSPDKTSVTQTQNTTPGVFHSNTNSQGQFLSGTIRVNTSTDDDFVGFVLGYRAGDLSSATADYLLIDWKQATQSLGGCTGAVGLAISRVTGPLTSGSMAWCHQGPGIEELARATTLGSTGWADFATYTFELVFTATRVQVVVDGTTEIEINGSFSNGSFGFYNYSQANVTYAGIQQGAAPIPLPAAGWLLLAGLGALGVAGRRRAR
ncbi:hypothetical protein CCR87_04125 [Rhodobaculum claviforme]|uniref:TSP C-terminal domain-containing protein n=2 Tax=Rhodobaculum claviforme TaxID=1549854 RepID=A0A934WI58_9RHOB|nr:hypothetical protein [Rhodobaculum claviforme]